MCVCVRVGCVLEVVRQRSFFLLRRKIPGLIQFDQIRRCRHPSMNLTPRCVYSVNARALMGGGILMLLEPNAKRRMLWETFHFLQDKRCIVLNGYCCLDVPPICRYDSPPAEHEKHNTLVGAKNRPKILFFCSPVTVVKS